MKDVIKKWWFWLIALLAIIVIGFVALVFYGYSIINPDEVLTDFSKELQEYDDNITVYQSVENNTIIIQCYTETNEEISDKSGEIGKIKGKYQNCLGAYSEMKIYFYSKEGLSIVLIHDMKSQDTSHEEWIKMDSSWYEKLKEELQQNNTPTQEESKDAIDTLPEENTVIEQTQEGVLETAPIVETPTVSMGQKNAFSSAKSYLSTMSFSYKSLIEQLEYEGYSIEEATYAVDNCGANWYEQAAKTAKSYIDIMSFSRSGLIEQLEYEGFTHEQAEYGATSVGY